MAERLVTVVASPGKPVTAIPCDGGVAGPAQLALADPPDTEKSAVGIIPGRQVAGILVAVPIA